MNLRYHHSHANITDPLPHTPLNCRAVCYTNFSHYYHGNDSTNGSNSDSTVGLIAVAVIAAIIVNATLIVTVIVIVRV